MEEFCSSLERIVTAKQKLLSTIKQVQSCQNNLEFFKTKNNIDTKSKLSNLQASLLNIYNQRLIDQTKKFHEYQKDYLCQKENLHTRVQKIPSDQRKLLSHFLNDLSSTANSRYSGDFSSLLKYEIDLLNMKYLGDTT